jgi:hypothetical protein
MSTADIVICVLRFVTVESIVSNLVARQLKNKIGKVLCGGQVVRFDRLVVVGLWLASLL